jgi:hypothetical protein
MAGFVRRVGTSPLTAWIIAAGLVVLLGLVAVGILDLHSGFSSIFGSSDYVDVHEHLAAADRSQPLHMRLEGQYPGPLQDTTIERWRDPVDGTVCYVYLPIAVEHSEGPSGLVQYGSANIGSLSCFPQRAQR